MKRTLSPKFIPLNTPTHTHNIYDTNNIPYDLSPFMFKLRYLKVDIKKN